MTVLTLIQTLDTSIEKIVSQKKIQKFPSWLKEKKKISITMEKSFWTMKVLWLPEIQLTGTKPREEVKQSNT